MNEQEINTCSFCRAKRPVMRQYLHAKNKPAVGNGSDFIYYCNECGIREQVINQPTMTKADWLRSEIEKLEGIKEEIEKLEKEHHEQFLADENRYKFDPSVRNLEVMKLHEGSTSAYARGLSWGKIEALTSIITRYKEELLELEDGK